MTTESVTTMMRGQKSIPIPLLALMAAVLPSAVLAQHNEVALTLGRIEGIDRSAGTVPIEIGGGIALQADYGRTLWTWPLLALQLEMHFLANPLRQIDSTNDAVTKDFASLFVTPGVRLKLVPAKRISPWFALGGGYALYEHSTESLNGQLNRVPRHLHRGALQLGAGIDVKTWRWLGFRGEIRDFYTGNPAFNIRPEGGQHNLVAGGGMLFTF